MFSPPSPFEDAAFSLLPLPVFAEPIASLPFPFGGAAFSLFLPSPVFAEQSPAPSFLILVPFLLIPPFFVVSLQHLYC